MQNIAIAGGVSITCQHRRSSPSRDSSGAFKSAGGCTLSIGPNGPNSRMKRQDLSSRTLANEWLFRRMYLRTRIPLTRPDAAPCSRHQRVPGQPASQPACQPAWPSHPDLAALLDVDFQIESTASQRKFGIGNSSIGPFRLLPNRFHPIPNH